MCPWRCHGHRARDRTASSRAAHDVVAAADSGHLETVPLQCPYDADAGDGGKSRHQAATAIDNSRGTRELLDETRKRLAEVFQGRVLGVTVAMGTDARTQLGVRAPDPVLIMLDDDWHGHDTRLCHLLTKSRARDEPRPLNGTDASSIVARGRRRAGRAVYSVVSIVSRSLWGVRIRFSLSTVALVMDDVADPWPHSGVA